MTAATITLKTAGALPAARGHLVRDRVRSAGRRFVDFMGAAYVPPAGAADDDTWRYYYYVMPMY
jgi:hypothetical protein